MMGKSIPLNNGQWKERIFVVTGCGWYLDEMGGMHVSCHSNRVVDILRKVLQQFLLVKSSAKFALHHPGIITSGTL